MLAAGRHRLPHTLGIAMVDKHGPAAVTTAVIVEAAGTGDRHELASRADLDTGRGTIAAWPDPAFSSG